MLGDRKFTEAGTQLKRVSLPNGTTRDLDHDANQKRK